MLQHLQNGAGQPLDLRVPGAPPDVRHAGLHSSKPYLQAGQDLVSRIVQLTRTLPPLRSHECELTSTSHDGSDRHESDGLVGPLRNFVGEAIRQETNRLTVPS